MSSRLRALAPVALLSLLLGVTPIAAQSDDEYEDDGVTQTVARLAWFEGEVSFNRGDDPDDWQPAAVNYPLTLGDRLWLARSARAELQLRGITAFLAPETDLAVLDLTRDVRQLSLTLGTVSFRIRALERDEVFEVATPNVSVSFESPGLYRIDVDEDGSTRIAVAQGRASAAAGGGMVSLERGDLMRVQGLERPEYDVFGLGRADAWDRWVEMRARRHRAVRTASYVHSDLYGYEDLDEYGAWDQTPDYGYVWYPRVAVGWEPYRVGRWIWRDPWGWTWLSNESWGWAPYHYGRWVFARNRWGWVPVGPRERHPRWAPALVGFVGGGPGWSVSVSAGGFVGWFPLGPREPFHPWWYRSRRTRDVSDYRYAYRSRAVVVPRDVFVRGRWGDRDIVRDPRVLRDIASAPILRGPLPVLPTREAIRVERVPAGGRDAIAPPRRVVERPVVTRREVPPAPETFDRKLEVIRERGGEPVPVGVPGRPAAGEPRREQVAAPPVRPFREGVALTPRGDVAPSRQPAPMPGVEARPPATYERPTQVPVISSPAPEPTRPARRRDEGIQPGPGLRPAETPVPRRYEAPEARPTRDVAPTPPPRPRYEAMPAPTRRIERPPAAEPRIEAAPRPAPRVEAEPTPVRRIAPEVPRRPIETREPVREAPPREAVRPRPEVKPDEAKPNKDREKAKESEEAPKKAPPRRATPPPD